MCSQYRKMIKDLYIISSVRNKVKKFNHNPPDSYWKINNWTTLVYSQIWLKLVKDDYRFFYIFLWMIATLVTNKIS